MFSYTAGSESCLDAAGPKCIPTPRRFNLNFLRQFVHVIAVLLQGLPGDVLVGHLHSQG